MNRKQTADRRQETGGRNPMRVSSPCPMPHVPCPVRVAARRLPHAGFTVIEVLVATVLLAVLIGAGYKFFIGGSRSYSQSQFQYRAQHEAQKLIEWVKLDLLHACKYELADPILTIGANTWTLNRFVDLFDGDRPKPVQVTYTFDPASRIVTRTADGGPATGSIEAGRDIEEFRIIPYMLNGRYFFRIEVMARVDVAETNTYGVEVQLRASVESRYDNNLLSQAGWIDNPQTGLKK